VPAVSEVCVDDIDYIQWLWASGNGVAMIMSALWAAKSFWPALLRQGLGAIVFCAVSFLPV